MTLSKRRRDCILGSRDSHRSGHQAGAVFFLMAVERHHVGAKQKSHSIAGPGGIRGSGRLSQVTKEPGFPVKSRLWD